MFTVRRVVTIEHYCPNGHPRSDLLPIHLLNSARFCHLCGQHLEEQRATSDAAYCVDCYNPVDPNWNYCPYCGKGREIQ